MKKLGLTARRLALLAVLSLAAAAGCADDSSGEGGEGGSAGSGGDGGTGGSSGDGGTAGTIPLNALATCEAWCRNEPNGRSCCLGLQCLEFCFEQCEQTLADTPCPEELTATLACDLDLACDDFFLECAPLSTELFGCEERARAEELGFCETAENFCNITETECLEGFSDAPMEDCIPAWDFYVDCVANGFNSCATCVANAEDFFIEDGDCGWPAGAGEEAAFEPQSCDTLTLPPAGCGGACPGGNDPECGFGTFCDGGTCEAECVSDADCRRADACSVRGRCLPTVFGQPLACAFFQDPPEGCGASCPSGVDCPSGTFCNANVCDAECGTDADCSATEECGPTGVCEVTPFDECSAERMLNLGFMRADATADCAVMGIPIPVDVVLTAEPTQPLQSGSNTFDIQLLVGFDSNVVDLLLALTSTITFTNLTADVAPTEGVSLPMLETISSSPLPCSLSLQSGTSVGVTFPVRQASWNLDEGSTLELTLEDVTAQVNAAGLPITLTTSGDDPNCAWSGAPPSLSFSTE